MPVEITVRHLQKCLESEVANWELLGFYLRVDVEKIQNQSRITPDVCLLKVIKCFLNDGNATWQVQYMYMYMLFQKVEFPNLLNCNHAPLQ